MLFVALLTPILRGLSGSPCMGALPTVMRDVILPMPDVGALPVARLLRTGRE